MVENKQLIRLNKAIAMGGIASRRKADELIQAGKVKVNNKVIVELGYKVSELDKIEIENKQIKAEEFKYILFYKPCGYITTRKDEFNRKIIYEILPPDFKNLKPVGRLDRDSEGLLLLTNDGDFINKILHPKNKVKKTYIVKILQSLNAETANFIEEKMLSGVVLDGKRCIPDSIRQIIPSNIKDRKHAMFEIVIHEGINRQVRRMFQVLGYTISELKRIKVGELSLGKLQLGKYKELNKKEIYAAFQIDRKC